MGTDQIRQLDAALLNGYLRFQTSSWHAVDAVQLPFVLTVCGELHNLAMRQTVLWEPGNTRVTFYREFTCPDCHKVVPFPGVKPGPTAQAQGDAQKNHPGHGPGQGAGLPQVETQGRQEA